MSTKKKRKPVKRKKPATPATFAVGDQVRVKYGTADPDFPDIPLGGWAGTVTDVSDDGKSHLYLIEWNQFTLDHMPPIFRKRCDRDGLELEESWLGEEDLESDVGDRVPLEQPVQIVTRNLDPKDQDDRIRAIFGLTSDDPLPESSYENVRQYHAYLAANLTFPFEAGHWEEAGPFQSHKCKISVVGLADLDCYCPEEVGLLFQIRRDDEQPKVVQARVKNRSGLFGFLAGVLGWSAPQRVADEGNFMPLDDLELTKGDPNRQLLKDFSYWMWNH